MTPDPMFAMIRQLREMSDAEVEHALVNCERNLSRLKPYTPEYNSCRHAFELVKCQREIRKANAGQRNLDWPWLLSSILGAYSFEPGAALGAALKPYGLSVPWPAVFYDHSGQAVLEIQMVQGDEEQVERILKGFEALTPFLVPGRQGYSFSLKTSQVKSRAKSSLTVHGDGTTTVWAASQQTNYPSFRAALEHISRELYWDEPPKPVPRAPRTRKVRGTGG